ncbi:MAG: DNA translocase FtsK 4TM domain-containing protein [Porphyromonas sp.]|uniref:FtsK/SpoIIIE family DNA translocase n=1 Tax=Porphyromonas sp. TaxID=1924944 RepID=UPI002A91F336|nr:DNA translocase FtsK 4TM domain-containing protein [Porphyromonas sp.]MDD7469219.1 DNA translocase FtsK 4TM domain-containing protein [Bacteroidales bacterium]MDY6102504.1 DNA translocase FtsK 4TM domain-containing protein [Porphyromonas sp.]
MKNFTLNKASTSDDKRGDRSAKRSSKRSREKGDFFRQILPQRGVPGDLWRFIAGVTLFFIGLFLVYNFFSYFVTGAENQSLLLGQEITAEEAAQRIQGHGGITGFTLMNTLVNEWIGLGLVFLLYLVVMMGVWITLVMRVSWFRQISLSICAALWTSVTLGLMPAEWTDGWFFLPGGVFGREAATFLTMHIGMVGALLLMSFLLILLLVITFSSLMQRYASFSKKRKAANALADEQESADDTTETVPDDTVEEVTDARRDVEEVAEVPEQVAAVDGTEVRPDKRAETPESSDTSSDEIEVIDARQTDELPEDSSLTTAQQLVQEQGEYDPTRDLADYHYPTLDLLKDYGSDDGEIDMEEINANKQMILDTLKSFRIEVNKISATVGPAITLYEIVPAAGIHISRIRSLEDNISMSLSALGIRIIAPIPGKGTIGMEVPNKRPQIVSMRGVLASPAYRETKMELPVALGRTITNDVLLFDLAKVPHLLVAGATGQGKSVGLNAIIMSLLYKKHPSELKFVMIDPKMVEFSMYSRVEKLFMAKIPDEDQVIITDTKRAADTLTSLCQEMDDRYELLAAASCRNIVEYNRRFRNRELNPENGHRFLPYIVLIIDEYGDLLLTAGKEIELPITRLAQKARAIGIHAIIATQRPTASIITGAIKANFPGRLAFRVTSQVDSRIILDSGGANRLVGKGDALYQSGTKLTRVQCAFVDTPEVNGVVDFIGEQRGYPTAYELPEVTQESEGGAAGGDGSIDPNERDNLFDVVAERIVAEGRVSISLIQQLFAIGYNRAARLCNQLEAAGIISKPDGRGSRDLLVTTQEQLERILHPEI